MKFLGKNNDLSVRESLVSKYNICRVNLLAVVFVTLLNVVLALLGDGTYFLFSASVPYFAVITAMLLCGKLSPDWYDADKSELEFFDSSLLVFAVAFALLIIALFFLFWLLSKNYRSSWLIAALVLFGLDAVGMVYLYGIDFSMLLDILFHVWVIYYLVSGIAAVKKLEKLPPDELEAETETEGVDYFPETVALKNGKESHKVAANYFRGREGVGGMLYFYNDRIIFKSHNFNVQVGDTTLRYADMTTTKARKNLGISNGLLVFTNDERQHRFVVRHRDDVMRFIDKKILAFKPQS